MAACGRQIFEVDRKVSMTSALFQPADILLPAVTDIDMSRWSVIACDQFTSDQRYWERVRAFVGSAPSSLHLMLPEYYLGKCDEDAAAADIQKTMRAYLDEGLFRNYPHSFIYLERTLPNGSVRHGLIGQVDLEQYDYGADSISPIRATEGTVESRLPARVRVRRKAALEMPHIMLFFNNKSDSVMQRAKKLGCEKVYDFDLMLGGGHVVGHRISGDSADSLAAFIEDQTGVDELKYAVGDGNHSLAAARKLWLEKRESLNEAERRSDLARFALVELVNIHDPAITFEPIHRALFHTDAAHFTDAARSALEDNTASRSITILTADEKVCIPVKGDSVGAVIDHVETFCRKYLSEHGGEMDYIHGDQQTVDLASGKDAAGILLPIMDKEDLFDSVSRTGPFPKKSFSIGLGPDKRYYLECRRL